MKTSTTSPAGQRRDRSLTLLLVGLFKLLKGVLLLAVGLGALELLRHDVSDVITHWLEIVRVDPGNRLVTALLSRIFSVTPGQLKAASVGTFVYAALYLIEGIGLLRRRRWAEYLTIVTTAGLIPFEVYELAKHFTPVKIIALLVNIGIVVYLVLRVRREHHPRMKTASARYPARKGIALQ